MEEKDKTQPPKPEKKKEKSLFEVAREIEEQQRRESLRLEAEAQEAAQRVEEEQRKVYEQKLREERIELMRLKQGVIEESETIREEQEEKKKYTIGQKISNFFYHNKWWMGIGSFFAFIVGFLVYQTVTTVHPDVVVLLISDNVVFDARCSDRISEVLEQYTEDGNGDGKITVDVYYIPASEQSAAQNGYSGDTTKLFAEFQVGDSLLVISDADADKFIQPEETLYDLTTDFGQYEQTEGFRFYLSDTEFAEDIGWDEGLDQDIYIGIREVRDNLSLRNNMQENFDIAYPALRQFIEHYGTEAAPAETPAE